MKARPEPRVLLVALALLGQDAPRAATGQTAAPAPAQAPAQAPAAAPAQEAPAPKQDPEAVVILRDGQRFTGFLLEQNDDNVLLTIAGIPTRIGRSQIEAIQVLPPVRERFRQMRELIADEDHDRRILLAEWLRARGELDLALAEAEAVLQKNPTHVEGRRLKLLVISQQELAEQSRRRAPAPPPPPPADPAKALSTPAAAPRTPPPPPPVEDVPALAPAEVNLIKVYETDLANPPRLLVDRDVAQRLIERYAGDPLIPATPAGRDAVLNATPARLLELMFTLQARDLYGKVQVQGHPRALTLFRDHVHRPLVINSCATAACHGGAEAGRLQFRTKGPGSDATIYTNFLILERTRTSDGKPLLDYNAPARSPLLQMALPRDRAVIPHPRVPNEDGRGDLWRPFFRSQEDERFLQALEWLTEMYRPRPDYPIDYTPPGMARDLMGPPRPPTAPSGVPPSPPAPAPR